MEHTTLRMISDLHSVLISALSSGKAAGASAPYVMVGSEIGAVNALAFSRVHPEQVHQVVMLDPVSSKLFKDARWLADFERGLLPWLAALVFAGATGMSRAAMLLSDSFRPELVRGGAEEGIDEDMAARQMHLYTKVSESGG
jgi:pimeloyl-ACP methyl ester carboxylesterase